MTRSPGRPRTISPDVVSLVALRLFDERGFDAVSMDDIAREAGVSRRSLFRLFPSKQSLVWGGLDEFVARFRAALRAVGRVGGVTPLYAAIQVEVWLRHLRHVAAPILLS